MALPDIGTMIPLYQILKTLHLSDSIAGIILVLLSQRSIVRGLTGEAIK
jgi:ABC-type glycerol-3-phosphate transport system permease component